MSLVDDLKAYATDVARQGAEGQALMLAPQLKRRVIWLVVREVAPYALGALVLNVLAAVTWCGATRRKTS